MASYNGNIDLLSLNGAKVITGIGGADDKRPYVCIPCDLNEIKVENSKNDANRQLAKLRVNIWPFNEQYKATVRQRAAERGDSNVSVPTHEMQLSFSVEYVKAAAQHFPKLVEQVKEANKQKDPDIVNQDYNDENSHLFKAIRNRMNKRIAQLYQPQSTATRQPYPQQSYGTAAGNVSAWVPPVDGSQDSSLLPDGYVDNNDDLPF